MGFLLKLFNGNYKPNLLVKMFSKRTESDLEFWEDIVNTEGLYNSDQFKIILHIISTYDEFPQQEFVLESVTVDMDSTPLEIEKEILKRTLNELTDERRSDLIMISSCVHFFDHYKTTEKEKINSFTERNNGKWFFRIGKDCEVVREVLDDRDFIDVGFNHRYRTTSLSDIRTQKPNHPDVYKKIEVKN